MFCELRRILHPDGLMSMNIFGSIRTDGARLIAAVVRTLREGTEGTGSFPHVQAFSSQATSITHNVYLLAAPRAREPRPARILSVLPPLRLEDHVNDSLRDQTAELDGVDRAPILRDDYNAAEHLDVAVRMRMRQEIRKRWGDALAE
jgi:hypothetical protein